MDVDWTELTELHRQHGDGLKAYFEGKLRDVENKILEADIDESFEALKNSITLEGVYKWESAVQSSIAYFEEAIGDISEDLYKAEQSLERARKAAAKSTEYSIKKALIADMEFIQTHLTVEYLTGISVVMPHMTRLSLICHDPEIMERVAGCTEMVFAWIEEAATDILLKKNGEAFAKLHDFSRFIGRHTDVLIVFDRAMLKPMFSSFIDLGISRDSIPGICSSLVEAVKVLHDTYPSMTPLIVTSVRDFIEACIVPAVPPGLPDSFISLHGHVQRALGAISIFVGPIPPVRNWPWPVYYQMRLKQVTALAAAGHPRRALDLCLELAISREGCPISKRFWQLAFSLAKTHRLAMSFEKIEDDDIASIFAKHGLLGSVETGATKEAVAVPSQ